MIKAQILTQPSQGNSKVDLDGGLSERERKKLVITHHEWKKQTKKKKGENSQGDAAQ